MIEIAGLVPLSSVDWPGKLAVTIFCQGCPWRCVYCQNTDILDPRTPGAVAWSDVEPFLRRRIGLLDAVVFSGGEALRQAGVITAAAQVKDLGFDVGLHTAGAYPQALSRILPHTDWVGLDIKALPEDYALVAGVNAGHKAWSCLEILHQAGTDFEVRTTVHPGSPAATKLPEILTRLRGMGVSTFALQEARRTGTPEPFASAAWPDGWQDQWDDLVATVEAAGFKSWSVRPSR